MRIVFLGTPDFGVPSLKALVEAGHDVAGGIQPLEEYELVLGEFHVRAHLLMERIKGGCPVNKIHSVKAFDTR